MERRHAPAAAASRDPLLAVLGRTLPAAGTVLELGSGTGEHAVSFAARFPGITWQPSDPDPEARASIAAWTAALSAPNVLPPLDLDLLAPIWRLRRADAVLCVNVLHAAAPSAVEALATGARSVLAPGGALVVAGPFRRRGAPLPAALAQFERALASRRRGQGLRVLEDLLEHAEASELEHVETAPLPQGCVCVVMRRR